MEPCHTFITYQSEGAQGRNEVRILLNIEEREGGLYVRRDNVMSRKQLQ